MTLKKRLVQSNLLMVVTPLIALIVASIVFGGILRSAFFSGIDISEITAADKSLLEIGDIINDYSADSIINSAEDQNNLMHKIADAGFHILAKQNGNVLFSNMDSTEQAYILGNTATDHMQPSNQTLRRTASGVNLLWHSVETRTSPIVFISVSSSEKTALGAMGTSTGATVITAFIVIFAAAVFIVLAISLFLASKMVKKIMIPMDNLCAGAERVQNGNFDEAVYGDGTAELTKVCNSFNEMQRQLKANIMKNEKYEQDRNEMLAGISHDLRTPLTSIKSYVKGLQDGVAQTPEKQRDYLDVVYRKSSEMENLLNELFLFSKLETGNMPFNFRPVFIQKYIVTLLDSQISDLEKSNSALTFTGNCPDLKTRLDSEQMTRAITNILYNSVKYNPGRHINITVTLQEHDGKIILRLQDDGIGVSDKQLSRLFDSFYRGDESRNNSSDGSGLGLAIAKNIVTAHGGSISAESYGGLAIIIELPIETEDAE
ncbi:HAMP domain-containing histidine kinase [Lachnospiraceae bacterium ZAX-1]